MKVRFERSSLNWRHKCALLITALLLSGCQPAGQSDADRIEALPGADRFGGPTEVISPLEVRVLGPRRVDFLGRKRERQPAVGVGVTFELDDFQTELKAAELRDHYTLAELKTAASVDELKELLTPEEFRRAFSQEELKTVFPPNGDIPPGTGAARQLPPRRRYPLIFATPPGQDADAQVLGRTRQRVVTDAFGIARVYVRLGTDVGAWRVEARIEKKGEKVHFPLVAGVARVTGDTEAPIGAKVPMVLRWTRWDAETSTAVPVAGRRITFSVVDEPGRLGSADIKDRRNETDARGERNTEITLGETPGRYGVLAEIAPSGDDSRPWRGVVLTVLATDWLGVGIRILVGVVLFVVGVRLVGTGFLLVASPYMHLPTDAWSARRARGFFAGSIAGTIFQSASLVTSNLSHLAGSGLLTAERSLGFILGANVGGTLLCQALAFHVEGMAAPLLLVGAVLFLGRRKKALASWAWVFVGMGLVVVSWTMLSEGTAAAAQSEAFRQGVLYGDVDADSTFAIYIGTYLSYLLLGVAAGFVFRTSNLMVVLAMLFVAHGILGPATAVPIVLGANVGAAAMVFVLNMRKRREAKRLSLLNLLCQAFGCTVVTLAALITIDGEPLVVRFVDAIVPGALTSPLPDNVEQHIATVHTFYNCTLAAFFLVFPGLLFRALQRLLPATPAASDVKPIHLDENLIDMPSLALRQSTEQVVYMTQICRKAIAESFDAFRYADLDLSDHVVRREQVTSDMHREVSEYLIEVSQHQLTHPDAVHLEVLQTAASSVARIASFAEDLRELTARKIDEKIQATEEVERALSDVYDLVVAQFENILTLLGDRDARTEENAVKMVDRLTKHRTRLETHWRRDGTDEEHLPVLAHQQTVVYQEAFAILFRVAAELAEIAYRMRTLAPERR